MRFKILRYILLLILTIILSSCTEEEDGLSIAMAQEPPSLDVMINTSISGREILTGNVFERLLSFEDGEIVPLLASSYELSDDSHTLRILLKENISFHDGTAFDAEDAVLSMNRWLSVSDAAQAIAGENIFHPEGDSIVISSASSLSLLPLLMATSAESAVVYKSEDIEKGDAVISSGIGTGPYRIAEYSLGEKIVLERYEDYHGDKPSLDKLSYYFVSDPVTRRLGLESGLYDFIDTVSSDDIPRLSEMDGVSLVGGVENGSIALLFNKKEGISGSLDFRKGVSLYIDRNDLMKACYGDYGYSIDSSYMESDSFWYADPSSDPFGKEDRESSEEYLSSFHGEKVRILTSNLTGLDRIAAVLSEELERAGFDTELIVLDWAAFLERRKNPGSWDIAITALTAVSLPLDKAFLSPSYPGWTDSDAFSLLEMIPEAESTEAALSLWHDAQIQYWEYIPSIVLGHYSTMHACSSSLTGIDVSSDGFSFLSAELSDREK